MPVIVLIETVRALIRPITLSVRLMANMVAGHLLLTLVGGAVSGWISIIPVLLSQTILIGLELAVALIQAYVFSVLVLLYAKEVPP
jgi:F-type H+-transporting ATPase subunit a